MITPLRHRFLLAVVVGSVALGVTGPPSAAAPQRDLATRARQIGAVAAPVGERQLTDAARVLAGMAPAGTSPLAAVAARPEWRSWQREFDGQWAQATRERLAQMAAWRDRELAGVTGTCGTLMYPFSGPDILNALTLFPNCDRYVLFGLEHPGSLPPLEHLSDERLAMLLEETRHALNDLLARNYFITRHMMEDTEAQELHGTFPLIAVFLVRLDARLISARDVEIAEDGRLRPRSASPPDRHAAEALELVFARPGRDPQTLVYFRAQAEDRAIDDRPGVRPFLERQAPFVTFLKSASYLLHGDEFTFMRDLLLNGSRLVLEDDSGIPLRFLKAPEWTVTLFGKYQKPVKAFNYGFQPDMARAYADERAVKPLTFSFGYHWEAGAAAVLLAVRNPSGRPRLQKLPAPAPKQARR